MALLGREDFESEAVEVRATAGAHFIALYLHSHLYPKEK
jgi:hypothetical protein